MWWRDFIFFYFYYYFLFFVLLHFCHCYSFIVIIVIHSCWSYSPFSLGLQHLLNLPLSCCLYEGIYCIFFTHVNSQEIRGVHGAGQISTLFTPAPHPCGCKKSNPYPEQNVMCPCGARVVRGGVIQDGLCGLCGFLATSCKITPPRAPRATGRRFHEHKHGETPLTQLHHPPTQTQKP
jgi:hypothetical protein